MVPALCNEACGENPFGAVNQQERLIRSLIRILRDYTPNTNDLLLVKI